MKNKDLCRIPHIPLHSGIGHAAACTGPSKRVDTLRLHVRVWPGIFFLKCYLKTNFQLKPLYVALSKLTYHQCIFCGTILTCVQTTQMNSNDLSMFFFIPPVPNEEGIRASRGRHRLQDQGHVRCGHLEGLSCSSSTIPTARKVTQNLGEVFVIHQSEGHLQGFLFLNHSTLWHNVA